MTAAPETDPTVADRPAPAIRKVELDDLPALDLVDRQVFGDSLALGLVNMRLYFDLFRRDWYVAEDDGELCGYVLVGIESDSTEAWLLGLAVTDAHQGKGLGRALMNKALDVFEEAKVKRASITVRPTNEAAMYLYKSSGFTQEGEPVDNYYGNNEPRAILRQTFDRGRRGSLERLIRHRPVRWVMPRNRLQYAGSASSAANR